MATDEKKKLEAELDKAVLGHPADWPGIAKLGVEENTQSIGVPRERHPRERLIEDLNDQEQRLLDKLVAIRQVRDEYRYLSREEAERLVKIARLADILRY